MSKNTQRIVAALLVFVMLASVIVTIFAGANADSAPPRPMPAAGAGG